MAGLLSISLHNVRFRAYHGLYPEERQKGNDFVVNLEVRYMPDTDLVTSLDETIDYAQLFDIINATMQEPVDLLETLVQKIALQVQERFAAAKEIIVSVEKINPPIDHFSGTASVRYRIAL